MLPVPRGWVLPHASRGAPWSIWAATMRHAGLMPIGVMGDTCGPVPYGFLGEKQSWGQCRPWGEQAAEKQRGTAGFVMSAAALMALHQAPIRANGSPAMLHTQHQAQPCCG